MRNTLFVLIVTAASLPALAADVAVFPVEGTNVAPGDVDAVGAMLAQAYAAESGLDVLTPQQAEASSAYQSGKPLAEAAQQLGVSQYIETSAVFLRTKMVIAATLRNAADSAKVQDARVTAASLDDMEQVAERLSAALHRGETIEETRTLHNVTKVEGRTPNRTWIEKVVGFKTGLSAAIASGAKFEPVGTIAFDMRFESTHGFLEWGVGLLLPSDPDSSRAVYGGLFADFGGAYYLGNRSVSPYVGGGVTPRILFGSGFGGTIGFAPYGQLGLMFMRESSTRLYLDLRVAQNVLPLKHSGNRLYPTEVGMLAGIGW